MQQATDLPSSDQPNPSRRIAQSSLVLAVLALLVLLAWAAHDVLAPYLFGLFVYYMALPGVRAVEQHLSPTGRLWPHRRIASTFGIATVILAGTVLLVLVIGEPIINQTEEMLSDLPVYWEDLLADNASFRDWYVDTVPEGLRERIANNLTTIGRTAAAGLVASFGWLLNLTGDIFDSLSALVLVPLFVVYLLLEEPNERNIIRRLVPRTWSGDALALTSMFNRTFGAYVRGVVLEASIIGCITGAGYWIIGVDLWLPLGVVAFIGEIIPILGPWIAFAVSALVILATEPELFIFAAMVFGVIQALEGWILAPRIQGGSVNFSQSQTILLLAIGGGVGGLLGMIFALPVAALLRDVVIYVDQRIGGTPPELALSGVQSHEVDSTEHNEDC